MLFSIIIFFVLALGLGFFIDLIIKDWQASFFEKLIIRIGAGILFIPVLGVLFNHLRIPIYWPVFLAVAILVFGFAFYFRKEVILSDIGLLKESFSSFRIKKSQIYVLFLLILFGISAYMYIQGSFNYAWFENGDPYGYALASKYIALEKTYSSPYYFAHFAYPYTQGYQIFMGILHQTNDSIYWTLKFFNALVVSLSILFFFYFSKKFTKKDSTAFWSTFALFAIPAWVSHFVFALNFNMSLMFLLFYALFSIRENKNWKYLGILFFGSIIINHFYTSFVIALLLIVVWFLRIMVYKDFSKDYLDVFTGGLLVGLIFWVPALVKHWAVLEGGAQLGGLDVFLPFIQKLQSSVVFILAFLAIIVAFLILYLKNDIWFKHVKKLITRKNMAMWIYLAIIAIVLLVLIVPSDKIIYAKGSGTRVYTFGDFFIAQKGNMINNPIGIGLVIMLIFLVGLAVLFFNFKKLFIKDNFWLLVALTWVILSFLGVMGASLSIGFVPFRMWTFFGMSMSLVTGYAIYLLLGAFDSIFGSKRTIAKAVFIILFVVLAYYTSFVPKYVHNTVTWPDHQVIVPESQQLYIWMREGGLPKDSMVLPLCHYPFLVLGYDMLSKPWENVLLADNNIFSDEPVFYKDSLNKTLDENYNFLKKHGYQYTILGVDCIAKRKVDQNLLLNRLNEMANSTNFRVVKATKTQFLFEVV